MTQPVIHETHVKFGREPGRGAERIALLGLVLVLIAVVKPWGATPATETASPQQPRATTAPIQVSMGDHPCTGRSWVIQVDKRWGVGRVVRSWMMTDAVQASGPADQRIRFVTVASPEVLALGYCEARSGAMRPPTQLTIYRLGSTIELVLADPVTVSTSGEASENVLFRPAATAPSPAPSGATPSPAGWESGRYALRIDGSDGYQRWLGLEIRITEDAPQG